MNRSRTAAAMEKVGGRFTLCVLLQKRVIELSRGAPQLVDWDSRSYIDVAIEEILQEKISLIEEEPPVVPESLDDISLGTVTETAAEAEAKSSLSI